MNTCIQILNRETAQVFGPIFCPWYKIVDKEDALNTAQVHPCWNRFLKHAEYAQCVISPVWCFTRCKSPLTLSISQHVCRFSVCIRFILYPSQWISHWNILKSFTLYEDIMPMVACHLVYFTVMLWIPELMNIKTKFWKIFSAFIRKFQKPFYGRKLFNLKISKRNHIWNMMYSRVFSNCSINLRIPFPCVIVNGNSAIWF